MLKAQVVICGAGIAGICTAYTLAVDKGLSDILLVDERPPLSLTSDRSSECYRNWWPSAPMVALMQRSIDRLEALAAVSSNVFHLNRRGYLYCTASQAQAEALQQSARQVSALGAGPLRVHGGPGQDLPYQPAPPEGFLGQPTGADLLLDPSLIHKHFPYLNHEVTAALHVRRAGWFSAQQLGMWQLERARQHGVRLLEDTVSGVSTSGERVQRVHLAGGTTIQTPVFVNAAGPLIDSVARLLDIQLPIFHELHLKVALKDPLGVLGREAPLVIWTDPQTLAWSDEERQGLEEDGLEFLLDELPPGIHTRPEGGPGSPIILGLWEYQLERTTPSWPIPIDPMYPEVVLRGLVRMLPGMQAYLKKSGRPSIDGGYYTKTPENRPLIGSLPIQGCYMIGALSGFGLMAASGAAELLAQAISGETLPEYAPAFAPDRFQDPAYRLELETASVSGQL